MGLTTAPAQSHTDMAYRTAVARLRNMLVPQPALSPRDREAQTRVLSTRNPSFNFTPYVERVPVLGSDLPQTASATGIEELLAFIDKQSLYINRLEKDTAQNRVELTQILEKAEDVVKENDVLQEQLNKEVSGASGDDGKGVVRISVLESELFKSKQSLRVTQEEVLALRAKVAEQTRPVTKYAPCELHLAEIEKITRERNDLTEKVVQLEQSVASIKCRETEAAEKVKTSLDLLEQLRKENTVHVAQSRDQTEEIARLQQRVRHLISENVQSSPEARAQLEKAYMEEITQLKTQLSVEIESGTLARTHLEAERRRGRHLRDEFEGRTRKLEEFRKNMESREETLETQLSQTIQRKTKVETDLMALRVQAEKYEREGNQEIARLATEVTFLHGQLTDRNSDVDKCDQVILALRGKIVELEENVSIENKLRQELQIRANEEAIKVTAEAVQQKYASERHEFENIIQRQNILMDKLRAECYTLAQKLEEISSSYKHDVNQLETEKAKATRLYNSTLKKCSELEQTICFYSVGQDQMRNRVQFLEDEEQMHSQKVVNLLTKQSSVMKQKANLEAELALMRSQIRTTQSHND